MRHVFNAQADLFVDMFATIWLCFSLLFSLFHFVTVTSCFDGKIFQCSRKERNIKVWTVYGSRSQLPVKIRYRLINSPLLRSCWLVYRPWGNKETVETWFPSWYGKKSCLLYPLWETRQNFSLKCFFVFLSGSTRKTLLWNNSSWHAHSGNISRTLLGNNASVWHSRQKWQTICRAQVSQFVLCWKQEWQNSNRKQWLLVSTLL